MNMLIRMAFTLARDVARQHNCRACFVIGLVVVLGIIAVKLLAHA